MPDTPGHVLARVDRLLHDRLRPAIHRRSARVDMTAWECPAEPVRFAEAVAQDYSAFHVGDAWGTGPWSTTWFRIRGTVPDGFGDGPGMSVELRVDLGFVAEEIGFQAKAWRGPRREPRSRVMARAEIRT